MRCHRSSVSGYVDGCRCDGCREKEMLRHRRIRNAKRVADGARWSCLICGHRFHTEATMYQHETKVHSSERAA